jgi:hypothetical protein
MTTQQLNEDEVSAVGEFLSRGFGYSVRPFVFTDEVIRWKYLLPIGGAAPQPRSLLQIDNGKIVGHIGLNHRHFRAPDGTETSTIHPMDWLAASTHRAAGVTLILKCFEHAVTQYAIGGTELAQKLQVALNFNTVADLKIRRRVIRPWSRLREPHGGSAAKRLLRVALDYTRPSSSRVRTQSDLELVQVQSFGPEVREIVDTSECNVCHTTRSADLLNHFLAYPGGTVTGWLVYDRSETVGFVLLNVISGDSVCEGRIVDCYLRRPDPLLWRGAVAAIVQEFCRQGADSASSLASTPWMEDALATHGFGGRTVKHLRVRDPGKVLPAGLTYHVTHLEADLGYLY